MLFLLAGCIREIPPDQSALFFSKNPELIASWELHPSSVRELSRAIDSRHSFVPALAGKIKEMQSVDTNLAAYLEWVENKNQASWTTARDALAELNNSIGDGDYLYWYETEEEGGHIILRNGKIVKKFPAFSYLKNTEE